MKQKKNEALDLERFTARLIQQSDELSFFQMVEKNRAILKKYFPLTLRTVTNKVTASQFVRQRIQLADKRELFCFVIEDAETTQLAGTLVIKNIDWKFPKVELSYYVDKDFQGQGLATQAITQVIEYGIQELKIKRFFVRIDPKNKASIKLAKKIGFEWKRNLKNDFEMPDGTKIDNWYMLLKAEDFNIE